MKVKSEFYISELISILHGINLQVKECSKILKKESFKTRMISLFMPWKSRSAWCALAINAEIVTNHVKMLSELREKILLSEGVDENMKSITLNQLFENQKI